jgi:peptidoglycan/xylan/chitin deacetylase (PgdA/CDA1 family)
MSHRTSLVRAALSAIHYSGMDRLASPFTAGAGAIFMLHHVRPEPPAVFPANRLLSITPDFLDRVIRMVTGLGFEPIALDEVPDRLANGKGKPPFAVFTLDDGYRDNRDFAAPVFRRHNVPFTIYVPADYADGKGDLWWLVLEAAVMRLAEVRVVMEGSARVLPAGSLGEKTKAFYEVYWWLRALPEREARAVVARLAGEAGFSPASLCRDMIMDWNELRELAKDPLVTIGAHTCSHYALAKLGADEARREIATSIARIEAELGRLCRHFSYPYGDEGSAGEREFALARELGMATAVTTRKGLVHARHASRLTALPRVSLNGDYQDERFVKVLLSGMPFAVRDVVRGRA